MKKIVASICVFFLLFSCSFNEKETNYIEKKIKNNKSVIEEVSKYITINFSESSFLEVVIIVEYNSVNGFDVFTIKHERNMSSFMNITYGYLIHISGKVVVFIDITGNAELYSANNKILEEAYPLQYNSKMKINANSIPIYSVQVNEVTLIFLDGELISKKSKW